MHGECIATTRLEQHLEGSKFQIAVTAISCHQVVVCGDSFEELQRYILVAALVRKFEDVDM